MAEGKKGTRSSGFTLIEVLTVILIIGILASIAVPNYRKALVEAEAARIIENLHTIGNVVGSKLAAGPVNLAYPPTPRPPDSVLMAMSQAEFADWLTNPGGDNHGTAPPSLKDGLSPSLLSSTDGSSVKIKLDLAGGSLANLAGIAPGEPYADLKAYNPFGEAVLAAIRHRLPGKTVASGRYSYTAQEKHTMTGGGQMIGTQDNMLIVKIL